MTKYALFVFAIASIALFAFAAPSAADPNLADVPKHRHFIETATGALIPVGPQICENADLQDAFNQFHYNVHHTNLPSLGPQDGAPGLHDHVGAEVTFLRGC